MSERRKTNLPVLLGLHALLVVFSLSGVLSKTASRFEFMSLPFLACYGGMVLLLGVYALGWQQVIKRMPLIAAYANRAVTVVWGIVWGVLLFHEQLNAFKVAGAAIVLLGVVLYALSDGAPAAGRPEGEQGGGEAR